jgi:hypothetical protein
MPIEQTIRGFALELDASADPVQETQPLLQWDSSTSQHMADKVLALRGVRFRWRNKEENSYRIGLIAQEEESVLPKGQMSKLWCAGWADQSPL